MTCVRYQTGGFAEPLPLDTPPAWWSSSICRSARSATTHMLHAISRPRSQKTAMMITPPSCSLLASGILVPCAVLSTRTPSDTVTGVIVRACGAWGTFLFRSRTSSDGRHKDRKIWGYERAKGGKTAGTGSGNPYMGFRRPVPAVCRMVSDVRLCSGCGLAGLIMPEAVKTCEEGQTRPMPGSSGRVSSGISAGSGGWSP